MKQKILITSALPYANGPLHFGHIAGAYLPGDVYARFERLRGHEVLYVCGSDEYGVAITLSAELAGRTPQEHIDIYHAMNKALFARLNFSFDHFSRTSWKGHQEPATQYFLDLLENGYIEAKVSEQLYSEADDKFLADRYVEGTCPKCGFEGARGDECQSCGASYEAIDLLNPRSKLTQASLIRRKTKHWFLLFDKFKDRLTEWLSTRHWKPNVVNFVKNYIEDLRPRAITRDSKWGIPVPLEGAEGKVLYVWFDAPIGYISASIEWAEARGEPELWKEFWCDEATKFVQFIGKDNIPFHAIFFPAMTMGQNQPYKLVDELPANEFYKLEGRQFSKSEGWYIDLEDFFQNYTTDQIRYTIAATAPETADSDFTWREFQSRCNAELLGKYGNLVNRALVFAQKQCEGKIPAKGSLQPIDEEFLASANKLVEEAAEAYEQFKLRRASQLVMELAHLGNVYFDSKKPWKDAKASETRPSMETTIACCLECLKLLALISHPIIPETAQKVWRLIAMPEDKIQNPQWDSIKAETPSPGTALPKTEILFRKIEDNEIQEQENKLEQMSAQAKAQQDAAAPSYAPLKDMIDFDDFVKIDLRVGQIIEAEKVPKSKKLIKLKVDIGFDTRQIIAGISQNYEAEDLIGKKIAVVVNLKPAKLMGLESQGMLLAASLDDALEVVSIQNLPPGASIS